MRTCRNTSSSLRDKVIVSKQELALPQTGSARVHRAILASHIVAKTAPGRQAAAGGGGQQRAASFRTSRTLKHPWQNLSRSSICDAHTETYVTHIHIAATQFTMNMGVS